MNGLLFLEGEVSDAIFGLDDIPTDTGVRFSEALDIVENTVEHVTQMITDNWILWMSLAFGLLGFSISIFRRLRKRK